MTFHGVTRAGGFRFVGSKLSRRISLFTLSKLQLDFCTVLPLVIFGWCGVLSYYIIYIHHDSTSETRWWYATTRTFSRIFYTLTHNSIHTSSSDGYFTADIDFLSTWISTNVLAALSLLCSKLTIFSLASPYCIHSLLCRAKGIFFTQNMLLNSLPFIRIFSVYDFFKGVFTIDTQRSFVKSKRSTLFYTRALDLHFQPFSIFTKDFSCIWNRFP